MIRNVRSMGFAFALSVMVMGIFVAPAPAFLTGVPTFTAGPSTSPSLGTIVGNTLTITSIPNGFQVTGQIQVSIAPNPTAPLTGILLNYTVEQPIDPTYPFNPGLFTTTVIDGFSLPPPGSVGSTAGFVHSSIVTLPSTYLAPSISNIPLSLVAGVDNPAWTPAIVASSGAFPFTGAPNMVLRQEFTLDGIYNSGPGGIWTIDLPVQTFVSSVPEPSTFALTALGLAGLGMVGWKARRCRK
jgi:hypothetical protein